MSTFYRYGGIGSSIVLIAIGVGSLYIGVDGRDRVRSELAREQIVGTPDSSIPGQTVDTGSEAQAFAAVVRKHTLAATGGKTYSEMGRFLDAKGNAVEDEASAAKDPKTGAAVENPARNIWISSTAFQTALNTAYFAESVATFVLVVGAALLLIGIGLLVLTLPLLGAPQRAAVKGAKVRAAAPAAG